MYRNYNLKKTTVNRTLDKWAKNMNRQFIKEIEMIKL